MENVGTDSRNLVYIVYLLLVILGTRALYVGCRLPILNYSWSG